MRMWNIPHSRHKLLTQLYQYRYNQDMAHYLKECDGCVYLGSIASNGEVVDLFSCDESHDPGTVLMAKYSNNPGDYVSYTVSDWNAPEPRMTPDLQAAYRMYRP